jgi:ankyrin repeat protein
MILYTQKKWTALHMAAGNNDLAVARLLLEKPESGVLKSALTDKGETALDWAVDMRLLEMEKLLRSFGVSSRNNDDAR